MNTTRVINLYANRKFYDKSLKGHITLLDILQAVKDGDEFIVVNKNKQDVTEATINAAIYKHLIIPTDIAKDLIQNLYEVELPKILPKENNYDRL